jgi:hypothetical protein
MPDQRRHYSFRELGELYLDGKVSMDRLSESHIIHRACCASHSGGRCDCDPEVRLPRRTDPSAN